MIAKWPVAAAPQCPAGDGPILPDQFFRIEWDGSTPGLCWHDDCAEDASANES